MINFTYTHTKETYFPMLGLTGILVRPSKFQPDGDGVLITKDETTTLIVSYSKYYSMLEKYGNGIIPKVDPAEVCAKYPGFVATPMYNEETARNRSNPFDNWETDIYLNSLADSLIKGLINNPVETIKEAPKMNWIKRMANKFQAWLDADEEALDVIDQSHSYRYPS